MAIKDKIKAYFSLGIIAFLIVLIFSAGLWIISNPVDADLVRADSDISFSSGKILDHNYGLWHLVLDIPLEQGEVPILGFGLNVFIPRLLSVCYFLPTGESIRSPPPVVFI